ncbi:MAG: asparagine synthase-related protein [Sulfurimicrobium sp.]|nr:asparagine synthase-related protein [Sulfurimicrobium sp.]
MSHGVAGIWMGTGGIDPAVIGRMAGGLYTLENMHGHEFSARNLLMHVQYSNWASPMFVQDSITGVALQVIGCMHDSAWTAEHMLQDFLARGTDAITGCDGTYVALAWDPRTETLAIANDRLGLEKLFLFQQGGLLLFASALKAIAVHPAVQIEIDPLALAQFLTTSHLLDDRSFLRGISVLPPATLLTVNRAGMTQRRYWTPRFEPDASLDLDGWAGRLGEVLRQAVEQSVGEGPFVLPCSGGLDSRAIAAFLPDHALERGRACSFGHAHCYDVRYGRKVARAAGLSHETLAVPPDFFRSNLRDGLAMNDGEVSIEALPLLRLMPFGIPGETLLTGFLGDVLSGGHIPDGLDQVSDYGKQLELLWQKRYQSIGFSDAALGRVLLPGIYREVKGATFETMRRSIEMAEAESFIDKAVLIELRDRQARYIDYMMRSLSLKYDVRAPFAHAQVVDEWLRVPLAFRIGQKAYRRMMVRFAPQLARIPEIKTQRSLLHTDRAGVVRAPITFTRLQEAAAEYLPQGLAWRVNAGLQNFGHGLALLSGGWLGLHNRSEYVHHDESIRKVDPEWFRHALNQDELTDGWFDKKALNALLEEHLMGKMDHSIRINNVVSFLEWRRIMGI